MIEKLKELLDKEVSYIRKKMIAAVLVPIVEDDGNLIMIKRSENLSRSAGHVAFPGGIREEDEDIVETAIRETEEELGVRKSEIKILGFLPPKEVIEHRIKIYPVVGTLITNEFNPNCFEIDKILVDSLYNVLKSRRIADWGPNFECDGELVWGASSRILDDLYLRILKLYGDVDKFFMV